MTLLFLDGFDHYAIGDLLVKWTTSGVYAGTFSITSSTRFGYGSALSIFRSASGGNSSCWLSVALPGGPYSGTPLYAGIAVNTGGGTFGVLNFVDASRNTQIACGVNGGALQLWRNQTQLGTTATYNNSGGWHHVGLVSLVSTSAGWAEVYLDSTLVIGYYGTGNSRATANGNTQAAGNSNVVSLLIDGDSDGRAGGNLPGSQSVTPAVLYDDCYIGTVATPYRNVILAESSLVAFWDLQETTGTTAADSKGTSTGTYTNGFTLNQAGPVPGTRSVSLNGTNAYVDIPSASASIPTTGAYSLEAWFKPSVAPGSYGLVGYGNFNTAPTTNHSNALRTNGNTGLMNYWYANDYSVGTPAMGTTWHHAVATWDGTTRYMYLDGVLVGTPLASSGLAATLSNFRLGCTFPQVPEFLNGNLAYVAIYNAALSGTQVSAHYNGMRTNNDFLGDRRIQTLYPNAAGANSQFTRVGGTASGNYTAVNDANENGDTSYVTSNTVGQEDTYKYTSLIAGTSTVLAVASSPVLRKTDAGVRQVSTRYRHSTNVEGNFSGAMSPPTAYGILQQIAEANPVTTLAWAVGDLGNEFGPIVTA